MEQWYFKKSLGTVSVMLVGLLVGWIPTVQATEPCIFLATQVSTDGGNEFLDADTAGDAATVSNQGAIYRLLVKNCSASPLDSVVVSDTDLGISEDIGFLDANERISITSENLGFEGLAQPDRCAGESSGTALLNVTNVQGTSGDAVDFAKDPAFIICENPNANRSSLTSSTVTSYPSSFFFVVPKDKVPFIRVTMESTHDVVNPLPYNAIFGVAKQIEPRKVTFEAQSPVDIPALSGVGHIDLGSADGPPAWINPEWE